MSLQIDVNSCGKIQNDFSIHLRAESFSDLFRWKEAVIPSDPEGLKWHDEGLYTAGVEQARSVNGNRWGRCQEAVEAILHDARGTFFKPNS